MEEIINLLINSDLKSIERALGIPYDRMYKWTKGKGKPKINDYNKLSNYFNGTKSNSSTSDLEEIESSIAEPTSDYKIKVIEAEPLHLASDPRDYNNDGSKFEELGDGTIRMRIKVIPNYAFASGYLEGFQDPEFYEGFETVSIEVFKRHQGHYLAFEVRGDSMTTLEPEHFRKSIFDGVKVIGRELPRQQWRYKLHTHTWNAWVIVHRDMGIMVKEIIDQDVDGGTITIHSLNPDKKKYPDRTLRLDDIEQIFNVVKKIDE